MKKLLMLCLLSSSLSTLSAQDDTATNQEAPSTEAPFLDDAQIASIADGVQAFHFTEAIYRDKDYDHEAWNAITKHILYLNIAGQAAQSKEEIKELVSIVKNNLYAILDTEPQGISVGLMLNAQPAEASQENSSQAAQ